MSNFKLYNLAEFESYVKSLNIKRGIKRIQLHHTYSPSYKNFNGKNNIALQEGMKNHHVKKNGWNDIGQHFTVFPDGNVVTGRSLEKDPAGIYGANKGAICIECLGDFDKGKDDMTNSQKNAIVNTVKALLLKFNLNPETAVTYHAWWSSDGREIGDYVKGQSIKSCPGTSFFGGNTLTAYEKNLLPLLKENNALKEVTEINDILWELANANIVTDTKLWQKKCEEDVNVYWLCRKIANKLRGII